MNTQHIKILQAPFNNAALAAIAISKLINDQLRHTTTEAEANAEATLAWATLNDLMQTIGKQLTGITTGKPCQCASCKSERAEAMAQAEEIFK